MVRWGKFLESYNVKVTSMTDFGPYLKGNLTLSLDMPILDKLER